MSTTPSGLLILTGVLNKPINVINTGISVKGDDGQTNVSGTVIGIAQTAHSMAEFATLGRNVGAPLPLIGIGIGAASIYASWNGVTKALSTGAPVKQSDIAGLVGGAAAIIGGGAVFITSAGVIIPLAAVVGLGAGAYQLAATVGGWTIDINGKAVNRPLTAAESGELNRTLEQAQQSGIIAQPSLIAAEPEGLGTPTRTSSSYFTTTGAHSVEIGSGGTLSDLWLTQKSSANGFADSAEFYAAVLASNPAIADVNTVQAGQTIYLPQKFADGSITYFYANGASINNNAGTGAYYMVTPNDEGGQTIYQRTGNPTSGYTVRQVSTNGEGWTTYDFTGTQATADSAIIETSLLTAEQDGNIRTTRSDINGDGVIDQTTTETQLSASVSLFSDDTDGDGSIDGNWLQNGGQSYNLKDSSQALFADSLIGKYFNNGTIDNGYYKSISEIISDTLTNGNPTPFSAGPIWNDAFSPPDYYQPYEFYDPIGAFYESISTALDPAESIASKTPTLLNTAGAGLSLLALQGRDADNNGKLAGSELNGMQAWADANEDGIGDAAEFTTLTEIGITEIHAAGYRFYTQGNSRYALASGATPVSNSDLAAVPAKINLVRDVPTSNYRHLRDTDNVYATAFGYIEFGPSQVKINYNNRSYLIGTDGSDSFNANYYAAYTRYFNSALLVNFLGGGGDDAMGGSEGNDNLWGGTGNDSLWGYAGADNLYGEEGHDQIQGEAGNDYLDGGTGNDVLFGQVGNDVLNGGDGDDTLVGFTASNESKQTLSVGETDNDYLYGGAGNDWLLGGLGNNYLDGGEGNDELMGAIGSDHLRGEAGDDLVFGGAGNDLLSGGTGNDELQGEDGNDAIYGGDGNDRLFGQIGDDTLYGGAGDDMLVGFTGANEVRQSLFANESDNNFLYGGAGSDTLLGGLGNDYLDGGAGADVMEGTLGDDIYIVNGVNDIILEQINEGYDTVISSSNTILNANIEALRLVEGYSINGTGNAQNNWITGNALDNILDGVTGADTMLGGRGNDTFYVDDTGDVAIELAAEGMDTIQSKISYAIGEHVENLNLLDFGKPEKGLVDGAAVLVYGYPKANELDYMQGDAISTYQGTCALTSIANILTQAKRPTTEAQVVQLAIENSWAVTTSTATDYQRGGSNFAQQQAILDSYGINNNLVIGYNEQAIANLTRSGRGVILALNSGNLWNDANYVDNGGVNHVVTITGVVYGEADGSLAGFYIADSGRQLVSDMTRFIGIADFRAAADVPNAYAIYTVEALKLWNEDINGTGNALDNTIVGNRGNNILDGGSGNDTLVGGLGNDTYQLSRGAGQDSLRDNDSTIGNKDMLVIGADISIDQIWLRQTGNDLEISILGTADKNTIQDWYMGSQNQIEVIRTADGKSLYNADVDKLVQAMAAYNPSAMGTSVLAANDPNPLTTVIAANWR